MSPMKLHEIRARAGSGFLQGMLKGLCSLGFFHTEFNPPRYPRNAQFLDQQRIGADMYRALERYGEKARRGKPAAT